MLVTGGFNIPQASTRYRSFFPVNHLTDAKNQTFQPSTWLVLEIKSNCNQVTNKKKQQLPVTTKLTCKN